MESITLRPVTETDEDFLIELYKSSRGDDLRGLDWDEDRISEFLEMQYAAHSNIEGDHEHVSDQLVMMSGEPIGRLSVETRAHEIRCVDLALLADYRNQGVGTLLIQRLQEQARPANLPLRLQVIRFNRAVNLLERLGFRRTSETGTHFQMEWLPDSVGSPANRSPRADIPRGVVDTEG